MKKVIKLGLLLTCLCGPAYSQAQEPTPLDLMTYLLPELVKQYGSLSEDALVMGGRTIKMKEFLTFYDQSVKLLIERFPDIPNSLLDEYGIQHSISRIAERHLFDSECKRLNITATEEEVKLKNYLTLRAGELGFKYYSSPTLPEQVDANESLYDVLGKEVEILKKSCEILSPLLKAELYLFPSELP